LRDWKNKASLSASADGKNILWAADSTPELLFPLGFFFLRVEHGKKGQSVHLVASLRSASGSAMGLPLRTLLNGAARYLFDTGYRQKTGTVPWGSFSKRSKFRLMKEYIEEVGLRIFSGQVYGEKKAGVKIGRDAAADVSRQAG